jgi:hypothetical protein
VLGIEQIDICLSTLFTPSAQLKNKIILGACFGSRLDRRHLEQPPIFDARRNTVNIKQGCP